MHSPAVRSSDSQAIFSNRLVAVTAPTAGCTSAPLPQAAIERPARRSASRPSRLGDQMPHHAAPLEWADAPANEPQSRNFRVVTNSRAPDPLPGAVHVPQPTIQPQESTFAALLYHLIATPRAARRFAAAYRELKTFVPTSAMAQFEGTDGGLGQYQVPMLLLAIRITAGPTADPLFQTLREHSEYDGDIRSLLLGCASIAPSVAALAMVEEIIRPIVADPSFPADAALFRIWSPRVERYTFDMSGQPRCSWVPRTERDRAGSLTGSCPA